MAKARRETTPMASRKMKRRRSIYTNVSKNDTHTKMMRNIADNMVNKSEMEEMMEEMMERMMKK